jgi:adenylate cyclase
MERARAGLPALPRLPVLSMGTGINTGMTIAGFMGSDEHIVNYTVFGREVNLASRLEGLSGHGHILIGEGTYAALHRDDPALAKTCVELPPRLVKGFRESVRIFEVPWEPPAPPAPAQPGQTRNDTPAVA